MLLADKWRAGACWLPSVQWSAVHSAASRLRGPSSPHTSTCLLTASPRYVACMVFWFNTLIQGRILVNYEGRRVYMISAETSIIYATFMKVDSTCGILERNSLCFKNFMCVYMYASCACTCTCTCTHQVHVHDVSCAYASICSLYSMYITCHVWTLGSGSCDICCLKCFLLIHYEYI